jgi:hypothetical protein
MFLSTTLVYASVLAVLCAGAGLLVDRFSGQWLPASLLAPVGAAALIAVSQLTTYIWPLAGATAGLTAGLAVCGFVVGAPRVRRLARAGRTGAWQIVAPVIVYLLALAPVLLAGRPSFSSYLGLGDSAFHMAGADYLMRHGMHFAHLDLSSSYGQAVNAYYNTGYPSGADTLLGASAFLTGLPVIWVFQPFNAFALALASGPAWLLARLMGLPRGWGALAAVSATVPALVFGYELIGSIKEITALPMILAVGALIGLFPLWSGRGARAAIPIGLLTAGGISALGVGFGVWILATAVALSGLLLWESRVRHRRARPVVSFAALAALIVFAAALPTWLHLSGSLRITNAIASTNNPGNLHVPLRTGQLLGTWLQTSYKQLPTGAGLAATYVLGALTLLAAVLGAAHLMRTRRFALASWLGAMLLVWLVAKLAVTTWVGAKVLVLTAPVVALLAWAGVAGAKALHWRVLAPLLGLAVAGGVLVSDALQYHGSNLAPTARYHELASLNSRFAARGPALFTDYDEYSLYVLRSLDVAGPSFLYPPPKLAAAGVTAYRDPVELEQLAPATLASYPLIVTRRDPAAVRPPAAYRLLWQGVYYQVWGRRPGAPPALLARRLADSPARDCTQLERLSRRALAAGARLAAAPAPQRVRASLLESARPRRWRRTPAGLVLRGAGRLRAPFSVPRSGTWDLWFEGEIMPRLEVALDGEPVGSIAGQLGGDSLVPNTSAPLAIRLRAGAHRLTITRGTLTLRPGDGGSAVLQDVFLTPQATSDQPVVSVPVERWHSLCGRAFEWVELIGT